MFSRRTSLEVRATMILAVLTVLFGFHKTYFLNAYADELEVSLGEEEMSTTDLPTGTDIFLQPRAALNTICGEYRVLSRDGDMEVLKPILVVLRPPGERQPGRKFTAYQVSPSGDNYEDAIRRGKLVEDMIENERYCITGQIRVQPDQELEIVPDKVVRQ